MDNWYEKIAKSGWLGDEPKIAAEQRTATWSTKEDPKTIVIKRMMQKTKPDQSQDSSDQSNQGSST
jgi:hypothetical protein